MPKDRRLRFILDALPALCGYIGADRRYHFVNRAFASAFGRDVDEVVGLEVREVLGAEFFEKVRPDLEKALGGSTVEVDTTFAPTPGAPTISLRSYGVPDVDEEGGVRGVVLLGTDVTARVHEEGVRRLQSLIIDNMAEGVVLVSASGTIVYTNAQFDRMLGYDSGELIGRPVCVLNHDDGAGSAAQLAQQFQEILEKKGWHSAELRNVKKDGSLVWIRATLARFDHPDLGSVFVSVHEDINDQRLAKEAEAVLHERLVFADRMASIGTLAAGVGHEINNPLAYVTMNLELIASELGAMAADAPSARVAGMQVMVDQALHGAGHVRKVVRDLQTFSRADEDRRMPVDVRGVMDLAINMAQNEIRHRAKLVREYARVPHVDGNDARLGQVFLNLLVNAAQAIPEGAAEQNEIRVSIGNDGDGRVRVEVRDSGRGMAPGVLARIFDPFYTTKPIGEGTGLGLSICHGIITALGGTIAAQSSLGAGSTFTVTLPSVTVQTLTAPKPEDATARSLRRVRVLVVDDNPLYAKTLPLALAEHDVTLATSGKEALDRLRCGESFDLILCDLMMPVMNGMDVHAAIARERPELIASIVFITGGAFTAGARAFLDAVPNVCLEKPIPLERLRELVSRCTG